MTDTHTIYTIDGAVQTGGGLYIKRAADDQLLELCRQGEYAYILSSRQVGKSSLMVRTAQQLKEEEGIRSAVIDLNSIGVEVTQDQWYLGILDGIANELELQVDIIGWWNKQEGLGPTRRLSNFFRDVLLKETPERVVLFFDEIDSTLSIPFADDFFAAIRAIHQARATTPEFKRLSFVLIGVATPSELIADDNRTPFNIGQRVELSDFTFEEALPLAAGLGANAEQALGWVLAWSGGHPYLTQRLCAHLAKSNSIQTEQSVQEAVWQLFESRQGQDDSNLQFVRDMLTKRTPDRQRTLKTYGDIRKGKPVADDERSRIKAHLKIAGVVRRQDGRLAPRNRIYERVFDPTWVKENMPVITARRVAIIASTVAAIALLVAGYFGYQELTRTPAERAARFANEFQTAENLEGQLAALAGLFELEEDTYTNQARNLFFQIQFPQRLFIEPLPSPEAREDQFIVTQGVYQFLDKENNELLKAMVKAIEGEPYAASLVQEIDLWLAGREMLDQGNLYAAEVNLSTAIHLNPENPGLYLDRGQVYVRQGEEKYPAALEDFIRTVELDKERSRTIRKLLISDLDLSAYLGKHEEQYPEIAIYLVSPLQRLIYDAQNSDVLPGVLVRKEGDPPTSEVIVNEVYDAFGVVYDFFLTVYERDSIDNQGMELQASVRYQKGYDNAFWNGQQFVFGDGDEDLPEQERLFRRFSTIDIVAREFALAMNQYEAGLVINSQSGALLSSFADVFAAITEQYYLHQTAAEADWVVGKVLYTSNVNGVGIRSLKAPGTAYDDPVLGKDPQPAHMENYVNTVSDNGGVNINSGIPSHAFYVTATEIGGYAWEKAGRIWYVTLCDRLESDSDFQEAADLTFQVAGELYGVGSPEQAAVRAGWNAVGINIEE